MRLPRAYSAERLEAACRHALEIGTVSYRSVNSILATGRDQTAAATQHQLSLPAQHAHIRGPDYYTTLHNGKESWRSCFASPPSTCSTNSGSRAWPRPSRSRPPCPTSPSQPTLSRRVAAWSAKEGVEVLREGLRHLAGWRLKAMGGWRRPKKLVIDIGSLPVFVQPVTWWICRPGSPTTMAITSGTSGSSSCNRVRPAIMMTTGIGRSRTLC